MDQFYFWIFMLFVVIIVLDVSERFFKKKKEEKENFGNRWATGDYPNFYEENRLVEYVPPITSNSVNISLNALNSAHAQFSNFATNGTTPPFISCPSCQLEYDCNNYPYEVDDKQQNVCSNCLTKIYSDDLNQPVYARSNGRPRQCRDMKGTPKATVPLWGTDAKYLTKLQSV